MNMFIYVIPILLIAAGILLITSSKKPKKNQKGSRNAIYKAAYRFFSRFFITQGQLFKIQSRLSTLSIYNRSELQVISTKYFLLTSSITVGLVTASFVLFKDAVSTLVCIAFALLVNNILVGKQIDKVNMQVYVALKHTLSSIRQEYMKLGSIPEAISEADISPILRKPFDEIHGIMTNTDGEFRLHQFYESSPFRPIQTLAGICYNINNSGDGKDEYGQSNFIQALTMLSLDVNAELQRLVTLKTKFRRIEYLPFVPILAMSAIESYFISIMPGTALIYNGVIGYTCRILVLLTCILSYSIITSINTAAPIKEDDRTHYSITFLRNAKWAKFIHNMTPKNHRGRKIRLSLKKSLSRKGIEHLYTEKVVWAIAGFIVAVIATYSSVSLGRQFVTTSTQQLGLVATDEMNRFTKEQILGFDEAYFNRTHDWNQEEALEICRSHMPGLTDLQMLDQIKRVQDKEKGLKSAVFSWHSTVLCIIVGIICWNFPNWGLLLRQMLVESEAEDDFLQLQTLVAILMNTDIDTIDALWQLCQHSRIHKDMLLYCYHSYPSNPEKELVRLQSKTPIIDFKRFIGKLALTISDLSLKDAFSDLRIERDNMIRLREISMYATINFKRSICGLVSLLPLGALVICELIIPIGYLGIKEFMSALSSSGMM